MGFPAVQVNGDEREPMARITGHSVPPSLAELFAKHVIVSNPYTSTYDRARADKEIMGRNPWKTENPLLIRARVAADWLTERHAAGLSPTARRDYHAARVAEIMAGQFPVEWWNPVPLVGQNVQLVTPTFIAAPNSIAPEWRDPLRQASLANYYNGATTYAVPAAYTDGAQKSPGWYADVQSTVFADRWAAQLRFNFDVNTPAGGASMRPLWARVYTRHELSASFRGNRFWASANFSPTSTATFTEPDSVYNEWRGALSRANAYRLPLSPPATPWAHTIERWHTADLIYHSRLRSISTINRFFLVAAPAVPNGRYFSRNDWCRCWFFCTPAVYIAKD